MKVIVLFYSMYGHVYLMAEAIVDGVREVDGCDVELYQVPELVPDDVLEKAGAKAARQSFAHVPVASTDVLEGVDASLISSGRIPAIPGPKFSSKL